MRNEEAVEGHEDENAPPPEASHRPIQKKPRRSTCTYEQTFHMFVDELRTQLMTAVDKEICDEAFGAIFGNPQVDPGPRLSQIVWDVLDKLPNTPTRPGNIPVKYELPPQDWPRFTERDLPQDQQEALAEGRRKMEKHLLRTRRNFTQSGLQPPVLFVRTKRRPNNQNTA